MILSHIRPLFPHISFSNHKSLKTQKLLSDRNQEETLSKEWGINQIKVWYFKYMSCYTMIKASKLTSSMTQYSDFKKIQVKVREKETKTTHFFHAHKNNLIRKPHRKIILLWGNTNPEVVAVLRPPPGPSCKANNPLHHPQLLWPGKTLRCKRRCLCLVGQQRSWNAVSYLALGWGNYGSGRSQDCWKQRRVSEGLCHSPAISQFSRNSNAIYVPLKQMLLPFLI